MLAVVTHNGISLINPASFKDPPNSFPISSSLECSTSAWSPDHSQLYLANSSSIKRYTPSECLLEELYHGSDTVTCIAMKDKDTMLFATTNKVWSLDCTGSKVLSSVELHKSSLTRISVSSDGKLLASVSAAAVSIHNLSLSSHTQLKGLPDRKSVTCCLFHPHSGRLLLGVGWDIIVYDPMRPSSPLKTVHIPGNGGVVGISSSPFSKTLVASCTSNGDVVLIDLDKDHGILKTISVKAPLACCAFTAEGAAIYLGTGTGKLLILDLRSLDKVPKSFTIGDGSAPIKTIHVQGKPKSHLPDTARMVARSTSATAVKSSPQHSASLVRTASSSSPIARPEVRSPVRVTVASRIRVKGGVTPKKKFIPPERSPLSEAQSLRLDAQLVASRPPLSHRIKPLRVQGSKGQEGNYEAQARSPSATSRGSTEPVKARRRAKPSSPHKTSHDFRFLGLGPAPESISGHLVAMRVQSGSPLNDSSKDEDGRTKIMTYRTTSESAESVSTGRKTKSILTNSAQSRTSSSETVDRIVRTQQKQEQRSATLDNNNYPLDFSDPELPRGPVTPISLGKNGTKAQLANFTSSGIRTVRLTGLEVAKWAKDKSQGREEEEKMIEVRKTRSVHEPDNREPSKRNDESEDEGDHKISMDERQEEVREELSLQVSPRRPTAPPTWLQSPHRPSAVNLNTNAAAQDFLRNIVHEVMYDFQRETKAEMTGLHLDLVRMGRGWKQELREIMGEWNGEIQELKAENRRLREENERLRRRY